MSKPTRQTNTQTPTSTASATPSTATPMVPQEKIAMRAYEKWCQSGRPCNTDVKNWLEAEMELKMEMQKSKR